ncbi:EI24 domain-containing protein [Bartonella vinsonii]|nr:EI24 domain-containing protein [Bartonella vinsonii]
MMDNKHIQSSKDHHAEQSALSQDYPPLDPAVERVRKKLMRFMFISMLITLILILVVLFGMIYKIVATNSAPQQTTPFSSHRINQETVHHTLSLPKGTQILSQSLSEQNIVLKVLTSEGQTKFMVYNYYTGALIAVLICETTESATLSH